MPSVELIFTNGIGAVVVSAIVAWVLHAMRWSTLQAVGGSLLPSIMAALAIFLFRGWPEIPPREDIDRLFLLGLLLAFGVALFTSLVRSWKWLVRALAIALMLRIILHGSSYLSLQESVTSWSLLELMFHFVGWTVVTVVSWWLIEWDSNRTPGINSGYLLAMATVASGLAAVPSGYISVGLAQLLLGAAAFGWSWGCGIESGKLATSLDAGHRLVWIGLLASATYFADLPLWVAWALLALPTVGWITGRVKALRFSRWRWAAAYTAGVLVCVVLTGAVFWNSLTHQTPSPTSSPAPTLNDYMTFPSSSAH